MKSHGEPCCRNLTLKECEDETHTLEMGTWSPPGLPKFQNLIVGDKTPHIGVFLISLESHENVDVENGLAWAIWTSVAHVMAKRRNRSQTSSLTPDH